MIKSNYIEIVVLFIVLFSLLFLRAFKIGPFSISSYVTVILMIFSINKHKKFTSEKGFDIYLLYMSVLVISSFFNGDFYHGKFWQNILVYHLPGIAFFLFSSIYINSLNKIKYCIYILVCCYLFNAIISFSQFFKVDVAWQIGQIINPNLLNHVNERQDLYDSYVGHSLVGGITGFSVTNGYYIATFSSILLAFVVSKLRSLSKKIGLLLVSGIIIFLFYVVQQRMALILCSAVIVYYLLIYNKRMIMPLFLVSVFVISFYDFSFISLDSLGRLSFESDNSDRHALFDIFFKFLNSDYVLFGGINHHEYSFQHNTFTSAWYDGGFFSFIVYVILYSYITLNSIRKISEKNIMVSTFAISSIVYTLYSQTHSNGVQNGAIFFWVSYSLMIASHSVMKKINY